MGRKDWVSGDLMERAEVGTLGHLLCVIFQLGKATGMEASFGGGGSASSLVSAAWDSLVEESAISPTSEGLLCPAHLLNAVNLVCSLLTKLGCPVGL